MYRQSLKRAGWVMLAAGILAGAATLAPVAVVGPLLPVIAGIAAMTGIVLMQGGPRAALWVRTLTVFLLVAGATAFTVTPLYQPLDLTITEIRLDPGDFAIAAAAAAIVLCLLLWVAWELGQKPVEDAITSAHIRHWGMRLPAQAGGGVVVVAALLLWLMLHGQSADLATSLASGQLGPGYRYHLSWISNSSSSHGRSVTGVVTAWNHNEVKTVLLHWETP
jgi:hypothetical protein